MVGCKVDEIAKQIMKHTGSCDFGYVFSWVPVLPFQWPLAKNSKLYWTVFKLLNHTICSMHNHPGKCTHTYVNITMCCPNHARLFGFKTWLTAFPPTLASSHLPSSPITNFHLTQILLMLMRSMSDPVLATDFSYCLSLWDKPWSGARLDLIFSDSLLGTHCLNESIFPGAWLRIPRFIF